jgi:hypothetical protein
MAQLLYEGGNFETQNINLAERQEKILDRLKEIAPLVYDYEIKTGKALALSSDCKGRISYASSSTNKDNDLRRVSTTFNRYIRRQLKLDTEKLPDHELNSIGEEVMKAFVESKFEVVEGTGIRDAYMQSYGNSSCMTGNTEQFTSKLLAIYIENPERIKLAKFEYGNSQARAILWILSEEVIIDRIYQNNTGIIEPFKKKIESYYNDKTVIARNHNDLPCDNELNGVFTVKLKYPSSSEAPYMDTFMYAKSDEELLYLSNSHVGMEYVCNDTRGFFNEFEICEHCDGVLYDVNDSYRSDLEMYVCTDCLYENYRYCNDCNTYHEIEDCTKINNDIYVCDECLSEYYYKCTHCNKYHVKANITDIGNSQHVCISCLNEFYIRCKECRAYHLFGDCETVTFKNYTVYVCKECITQGQIEQCSSCNTYHYSDNMFFFFGSYFCSSCELETSTLLQVA